MNRGLRAALWTIGSVVVIAGILIGGWVLWPIPGLNAAPDTPAAEPPPRAASTAQPTAPTPTPTPIPEGLTDPDVSLTLAADGSIWRSTDGSCAEGVRPKLERSPDGGVTWTDVTPASPDLRQIVAMNGGGPIPFELVVLAGDDCRLAGLGSYTDGQFWEFYDRVLTDSTFIAPGATTVSVAGAQIPLPCEGAFGPAAAAETLTVLCPTGGLQSRVVEAWIALPGFRILSAAIAGSGRVVAVHSASCDGVLISGFRDAATPSTSTGGALCIGGIDPSQGVAVALAASGDQVYVWDGASFQSVAIPAA